MATAAACETSEFQRRKRKDMHPTVACVRKNSCILCAFVFGGWKKMQSEPAVKKDAELQSKKNARTSEVTASHEWSADLQHGIVTGHQARKSRGARTTNTCNTSFTRVLRMVMGTCQNRNNRQGEKQPDGPTKAQLGTSKQNLSPFDVVTRHKQGP